MNPKHDNRAAFHMLHFSVLTLFVCRDRNKLFCTYGFVRKAKLRKRTFKFNSSNSISYYAHFLLYYRDADDSLHFNNWKFKTRTCIKAKNTLKRHSFVVYFYFWNNKCFCCVFQRRRRPFGMFIFVFKQQWNVFIFFEYEREKHGWKSICYF